MSDTGAMFHGKQTQNGKRVKGLRKNAVSRCGGCGGPNWRADKGRYCHACHAEANKRYRERRTAAFNELKARTT